MAEHHRAQPLHVLESAVVWSLDDLPELAADIHRDVTHLLIAGSHDIDSAILDRLRGTTPDATDDVRT